MTKLFAILVAAALTVSLPAIASAGNVALFPDLAFKPVTVPSNGERRGRFLGQQVLRQLDAGQRHRQLVHGGSDHFRRRRATGRALPGAARPLLSNPLTANAGSMQYLGKTDGEHTPTTSTSRGRGRWTSRCCSSCRRGTTRWSSAGTRPATPTTARACCPRPGPAAGPLQRQQWQHQAGRHGLGPNPGRLRLLLPQHAVRRTGPARRSCSSPSREFNRIGGYFDYFTDPDSGI